jgi:hypothetical protein
LTTTKILIEFLHFEFFIPVILNRLSPISISTAQPNLLVSLTNIIGAPIKQVQFNVEAESAKSQKSSGALFTAKKAFTSKSSDGTSYELRLLDANQQPTADFYHITILATPKTGNDKRFLLIENKVEVKVTTSINVVDLNIGVADREQSTPKLTK